MSAVGKEPFQTPLQYFIGRMENTTGADIISKIDAAGARVFSDNKDDKPPIQFDSMLESSKKFISEAIGSKDFIIQPPYSLEAVDKINKAFEKIDSEFVATEEWKKFWEAQTALLIKNATDKNGEALTQKEIDEIKISINKAQADVLFGYRFQVIAELSKQRNSTSQKLDSRAFDETQMLTRINHERAKYQKGNAKSSSFSTVAPSENVLEGVEQGLSKKLMEAVDRELQNLKRKGIKDVNVEMILSPLAQQAKFFSKEFLEKEINERIRADKALDAAFNVKLFGADFFKDTAFNAAMKLALEKSVKEEVYGFMMKMYDLHQNRARYSEQDLQKELLGVYNLYIKRDALQQLNFLDSSRHLQPIEKNLDRLKLSDFTQAIMEAANSLATGTELEPLVREQAKKEGDKLKEKLGKAETGVLARILGRAPSQEAIKSPLLGGKNLKRLFNWQAASKDEIGQYFDQIAKAQILLDPKPWYAGIVTAVQGLFKKNPSESSPAKIAQKAGAPEAGTPKKFSERLESTRSSLEQAQAKGIQSGQKRVATIPKAITPAQDSAKEKPGPIAASSIVSKIPPEKESSGSKPKYR